MTIIKKLGRIYELDDLVSVAYMGLAKAAVSFDKELNYKFSTYAYTYIKTELCNYIRSNRRHQHSLYLDDKAKGFDDDLFLVDIIASDINIEDDFEDNSLISKLLEEIEKLPKLYSAIIKYKLQGMSLIEIGKIMNLSQPTVGKYYNRAINLLRVRLRNWG